MNRVSVERDFKMKVLPTLAGGLFRQAAGKVFACVSLDGVLVALCLRVVGDTIRRYSFELGAMNIYEPHDFICLSVGGKFPDFHNGASYNAKDQECLNRSMKDVADKFTVLDRDWIRPVLSQPGLENRLLQLERAAPHLWKTGHICRSLGYACLRQGQAEKAVTWLSKARDQYLAMFSDNPQAQWAADAVRDCNQLMALTTDGADALQSMLEENKARNIKSLKLEKAISAQEDARSSQRDG